MVNFMGLALDGRSVSNGVSSSSFLSGCQARPTPTAMAINRETTCCKVEENGIAG